MATGRLLRTIDLFYESIQVGAVTVGTSQVLLAAGASTMADRKLLAVFNNSGTTIFIGPSGVTTTSGYPIPPNDSIVLPTGQNVYAIAGSAGNNVRVLEAK